MEPNYMKHLLLLQILLLAGCQSLTPEAQRVRVITPAVAVATKCTHLGMVSAYGAPIEGGLSAAHVKARNKVAAAGGNALVITGQTADGDVLGDAYSCPIT